MVYSRAPNCSRLRPALSLEVCFDLVWTSLELRRAFLWWQLDLSFDYHGRRLWSFLLRAAKRHLSAAYWRVKRKRPHMFACDLNEWTLAISSPNPLATRKYASIWFGRLWNSAELFFDDSSIFPSTTMVDDCEAFYCGRQKGIWVPHTEGWNERDLTYIYVWILVGARMKTMKGNCTILYLFYDCYTKCNSNLHSNLAWTSPPHMSNCHCSSLQAKSKNQRKQTSASAHIAIHCAIGVILTLPLPKLVKTGKTFLPVWVCVWLSCSKLVSEVSPDHVDWSVHFPSFFPGNGVDTLLLNTSEYPTQTLGLHHDCYWCWCSERKTIPNFVSV